MLSSLLNYPKLDCEGKLGSTSVIVSQLASMVNKLTYIDLNFIEGPSGNQVLVTENFVLVSERLKKSDFEGKEIGYNSTIPVIQFPEDGITIKDSSNPDTLYDF